MSKILINKMVIFIAKNLSIDTLLRGKVIVNTINDYFMTNKISCAFDAHL